MKKILFAAMAVVAFVACSNDVETDAQQYAIDFNPTAKGAVRATVVDNTNLMKFFVEGYHNDAIYMDVTVTRANVSSNWTYENKKYWPAEGTVDFYGLYMENMGTSDGEYQSSFHHTAAGYTLDLRMSPTDGSVRTSYIPDPVYAVALDKTKADNPVLMQFRHAVSEVDFKIKNATTSDLNIEIASGDVYIEELKYQGIYTTPTISTTDTSCTGGSWAFNDSVTDYLFKADNGVVVASGETKDLIAENCLVFPQSKSSAKILVNCKISQDGVTIFDGVKTATVDIAWKEGMKYTYTLLFDDESIDDLSDTIEFITDVKTMPMQTMSPIRPN